MAGEVQLKLQASLDLAYLRSQVASIGKSLGDVNFAVTAKLNTKELQKDIRALSKGVKIQVGDEQIAAARLRLASLNKSLATFRRATATPLEIKVRYVQEGKAPAGLSAERRGTFRQRLESVDPGQIKQLYRAAAEAGLVAFDEATSRNKGKIVTALNKAGQDAVSGLLNGVSSGNPKLQSAAKNLGDGLIRAFKDALDIASPSKRTKKEIGEPIGQGVEKGVEESLRRAQSLNVADLRRYFNALKNEAQKGSAQVAALIAASMSGMVQLPGTRQQRARIQQTGASVNAAMTGAALSNVQSRQAGIRQQTATASSVSPSLLASLPILMGMKPQELQQRLSGLYGQQYKAPSLEGFTRPDDRRIHALVELLSSTRRGLRAETGGIITQGKIAELPGIVSSGYRNAAIAPQFVSYPPGMPAAYEAGFTGASAGRFGMQYAPPMPMTGMMGPASPLGQITARTSMFEGGSSPLNRLIQGIQSLAQNARSAASVINSSLNPSFANRRAFVTDVNRSVSVQSAALGGYLGANFVNPRGGISYYSGRQFPVEGIMAPSSPLGQITARSSMFAGGGGNVPPGGGGGNVPPGGGGGFNFGPNFGRDLGRGFTGGGGRGLIGEIASEFGEATKQVLLFGTAYKALAAITALPGNIANATANLQSFRNQLEAVTGGGQTMTNALELIESTIDKFNMPIESARQGFVRLYASMAPAGIATGTINNIFTGLAAASTTLGMSSDQVDRMTYALSQMASKGQITSEELKGQLGDVFPQAVSLFAEAAGFLNDTMDEQANAKGLSSFLKALEEGALRGEAMSKVLSNVGILLNQDFGANGEKAAASFRGQINALNNALTEFYESFAPAAGAFLSEFVTPVIKALTTVGEAVKLALSGEAITNNPLAEYLRNELFPQLENIKTALIGAAQTFGLFGGAIAVILRPIAQLILGNETLFSGIARGLVVLLAFRTSVAALNALGILPLITNITRYGTVFRLFIAQKAAGTTGVRAFNTALSQTSLSATQAIGGIRALATTIRTVLVNSAIGVAVVAIGLLIERINQLQATAASIRARGQGVSARLTAAASGGSESLSREEKNIRAEIATANRLRALYAKGAAGQTLSDSELKEIQDQGGDISMFGPGFVGMKRRQAREAASLQQRNVLTMQARLQETLSNARKNAAVVDKRAQEGAKIDLTGLGADLAGEGRNETKKAAQERESQLPMLQLELEKTRELFSIDRQIAAAELSQNTVLLSSLELRKKLVELQYEGKQIALENIPVEEQNAKLAALRIKYDQSILDSQLRLQIEMQKERDEIKKSIDERLKGYRDENESQRRYYELIRSGIRPELAKAQVEVEKAFAQDKERLQTLIDQYTVQEAKTQGIIEELGLQQNLSDVDQKRLEDARERLRLIREQLKALGLQQGADTPEAQQRAIAAAQAGRAPQPLDVRFAELKDSAQDSLDEVQDPLRSLQGVARTVADSIGEAFKGLITGATSLKDALAGVFSSIADRFADMVAEMIAEWLFFQIITGIGNILGMGSSPTMGGGSYFDPKTGLGVAGPNFGLANGGIIKGTFMPITPFATGGIVTGPTMGLVGEGRFNEAVVPLPDGKSIPVELGDGAGNQIMTNITVNVNNGQMQSNGNGSPSELGRKLEGAVKQILISELRPGGVLASGRR